MLVAREMKRSLKTLQEREYPQIIILKGRGTKEYIIILKYSTPLNFAPLFPFPFDPPSWKGGMVSLLLGNDLRGYQEEVATICFDRGNLYLFEAH